MGHKERFLPPRLSDGYEARLGDLRPSVRQRAKCAEDRDRGTPHGATPPTPPGIRVAYHGGSTGLSWDRDMESGKTE